MPVAKSYQSLEILCEPYVLDKGRQYVKVRTKNGENKQVRWYTDAEYAKMYPEAKAEVKPAVPIGKPRLASAMVLLPFLKEILLVISTGLDVQKLVLPGPGVGILLLRLKCLRSCPMVLPPSNSLGRK